MNKSQLKEVILQEFNSLLEAKYELYHKSFTAAATEARKHAEKQGYEIDDDSYVAIASGNFGGISAFSGADTSIIPVAWLKTAVMLFTAQGTIADTL